MRNPYGRRGSPAHRHRVLQVEQRLADQGWQTVAGGSLPEQKVGHRYPDLVMQRDQSSIAIQVGKTNAKGLPVTREQQALTDLRATGNFNHVFFLNYSTRMTATRQARGQKLER